MMKKLYDLLTKEELHLLKISKEDVRNCTIHSLTVEELVALHDILDDTQSHQYKAVSSLQTLLNRI